MEFLEETCNEIIFVGFNTILAAQFNTRWSRNNKYLGNTTQQRVTIVDL